MAATSSPIPRAAGARALRLPPVRLLFLVYGPALAVLALVALLGVLDQERSLGFLTRDPGDAVRIEGCDGAVCASAGLLSNAGAVVWAAGAAVALLAGILQTGWRRRLLLAGAALTAVLLLDDLFMLHDHVWPAVHSAGQSVSQLAIAGLGALYVFVFRSRLAVSPPLFLVAAAAFLGASLMTDFVGVSVPLVDDGAKFLGIVSWTAWLVIAAARSLQGVERAQDRDRLGA